MKRLGGVVFFGYNVLRIRTMIPFWKAFALALAVVRAAAFLTPAQSNLVVTAEPAAQTEPAGGSPPPSPAPPPAPASAAKTRPRHLL